MNQPGFQFGKFGGKAGLILAALGLAAIGVGWNGAASQLTLIGQIPYLISGGLIGVSLVILGAAMLVVTGARDDRAALEAKLDLLTDAVLASSGPRVAPDAPADASGLVIAGTASYHVPGCRLVDGREETSYLTPDEARAGGLKPCRVCQPEAAQTNVTIH